MTEDRKADTADGVSIVIPAFNEEGGMADSIRNVRRAMDATQWVYELLVVDDGSSDRTGEIARNEYPQGKGQIDKRRRTQEAVEWVRDAVMADEPAAGSEEAVV